MFIKRPYEYKRCMNVSRGYVNENRVNMRELKISKP